MIPPMIRARKQEKSEGNNSKSGNSPSIFKGMKKALGNVTKKGDNLSHSRHSRHSCHSEACDGTEATEDASLYTLNHGSSSHNSGRTSELASPLPSTKSDEKSPTFEGEDGDTFDEMACGDGGGGGLVFRKRPKKDKKKKSSSSSKSRSSKKTAATSVVSAAEYSVKSMPAGKNGTDATKKKRSSKKKNKKDATARNATSLSPSRLKTRKHLIKEAKASANDSTRTRSTRTRSKSPGPGKKVKKTKNKVEVISAATTATASASKSRGRSKSPKKKKKKQKESETNSMIQTSLPSLCTMSASGFHDSLQSTTSTSLALELKLEREIERNDTLQGRMAIFDERLKEQDQMTQALQRQNELQLKDFQKQISEKNEEIARLKAAIKSLEHKTHNMSEQTVSIIYEKDAKIASQQNVIERLKREFVALEDGTMAKRLRDRLANAEREKTKLKSELDLEKNEGRMKLRSKDAAIEFLIEELAVLRGDKTPPPPPSDPPEYIDSALSDSEAEDDELSDDFTPEFIADSPAGAAGANNHNNNSQRSVGRLFNLIGIPKSPGGLRERFERRKKGQIGR